MTCRSFYLVLALWGLPALALGQQSDALELGERFTRGAPGERSDMPWWEDFGDGNLEALIEEALEGNHDVAASLSRLRAADAQVTRAVSPLLPTLSLDASLNLQPSASLGFQFGGIPTSGATSGIPGAEPVEMPDVVLSTSAMVNLRYQIDLWGSATQSYRASKLMRAAVGGDSEALGSALAVQVGGAYFDVVAARQQREIVTRQIELNQRLLDLLQLRFENDQATAADVLQQRQQLASSQARMPAAQAIERAALYRLAVLLGRSVSQGEGASFVTASTLPELPAETLVGRPGDLLDQRPELRAARARVEAAERQESSATRSMLPTLAISGSAGYQGFRSTDYRDQSTWGVGLVLSVPAFRGFAEQAAVREARANLDAARHALSQAALQAVADVEGALAAEVEQRAQLEAHRSLLEAARQAFEVSRDSYVAGVGNYLQVQATLGALQAAELTVLQSERALITARLQLHLALGGQWTRGLTRASGR